MNKMKNYIRPAIKCFHDFDKFYLLSCLSFVAHNYNHEGSGHQLAKELPFDEFCDEEDDAKKFWSD